MDRDETLHERSAYEFVRDQLTPDQQAELDVVDAYWRAHPKEFNADFAVFHMRENVFHIRENKKTELEGFVWDENGKTPEIPRSHWWWYPIKADA